jgi:hypothetical protein
MRAHRAARTVGALTLGATLAGAAACGTGTEDKATACKNMRAAVESNAKQLSSPQELARCTPRSPRRSAARRTRSGT